jgi:hypothetical protein
MASFLDNIKPKNNVPEIVDDIKLAEHIDEARILYDKTKKNNNTCDINESDKQIKIIFSELIINIRDIYQSSDILSNNLYIHYLDSKSLSDNKKPYAYSDCTNATEIFNKLSEKIEKNHLEVEQILAKLNIMETDLIKIRRIYNSIINNM